MTTTKGRVIEGDGLSAFEFALGDGQGWDDNLTFTMTREQALSAVVALAAHTKSMREVVTECAMAVALGDEAAQAVFPTLNRTYKRASEALTVVCIGADIGDPTK